MSVLIPKRTLKNAPRAGADSLRLTDLKVATVQFSAAPEIKIPGPVKSGMEDLGAGMTTLAVGISVKQKADAKRAEEQEKKDKEEKEKKLLVQTRRPPAAGDTAVADAAARQQAQFDTNRTAGAVLGFSDSAQAEFVRWRGAAALTDPASVTAYDKYLNVEQAKAEAALPAGVSDEARDRLRAALGERGRIYSDAAIRVHLDAVGQETDRLIDRHTAIAAEQAARDPQIVSLIADDLGAEVERLAGAMTSDAGRSRQSTARSSVVAAAVTGPMAREDFTTARSVLGSDAAAALSNETRRALESDLERGHAVAKSDIRTRMQDHLRLVETTGAGLPGWADRVARVFDGDEAARLQADETVARQIHAESRRFIFEAPNVIDAGLAAIRPANGGSVAGERQRLFEGLERQRNRIVAERLEDPAGYAQKAPEIRAAYEAAAHDPAALPGAVGRSLALQAYMGIEEGERRVLPKQVAEQTAAQLNALDPKKLNEELRGLESHYDAYWQHASCDLERAGLLPDATALASAPPEVRAVLTQAMTIGPKALADAIGPRAMELIEQAAPEPPVRQLAMFYTLRGAAPADAVRKAAQEMARVLPQRTPRGR